MADLGSPVDGAVSERRRMCAACWEAGRCRFGLTVTERAGETVGVVTFPRSAAVAEDVVHGGLIAAVLDETCGNVGVSHGVVLATAHIGIDYLQPVRVETPLEVIAWLEERRGRHWRILASLCASGSPEVLARAEGDFVELTGPRSAREA